MGLLVAGVTGGQSLIEAAKIRGVINEMENIKRAVNAYYIKKGRLPGDPDEVGQIAGKCGYYNYSDCAGYGRAKSEYFVDDLSYPEHVDAMNIPFYEMNEEGILDYNLDNEGFFPYWDRNKLIRTKTSKIIKSAVYIFTYIGSNDTDMELPGDMFDKNILQLRDGYIYLKIDFVEGLDKKIDDGLLNSGNITGDCLYNAESYEDAEDGCYAVSTGIDI